MKPIKNRNITNLKILKKGIFFGVIIGLVLSITSLIVNKSLIIALIILISTPFATILFFYFRDKLKKIDRIRKMETAFPDFLQLMSSNLRAGITIDRAILLSVREEFDPLDKEIKKTGREIATGIEIEIALSDMGKRIGSEKIQKNIFILISGIRAGGNIATLLEETSVNMREKEFIEKRAASNVLMYVIFIFIAVSMGAPALFALSTILVETLTGLLAGIPQIEQSTMSIPFTLTSVNISTQFIFYFSLVFVVVTNILASLVLGLVNKGNEKEGLKFLPALLAISLTVFFGIRFFLSDFMKGLFS